MEQDYDFCEVEENIIVINDEQIRNNLIQMLNENNISEDLLTLLNKCTNEKNAQQLIKNTIKVKDLINEN